MIPGDPFSISSSMGGFIHQEPHLNPNSNPNPSAKPNSSSAKKKRNQPGTPGTHLHHHNIYAHIYICASCVYIFISYIDNHTSNIICISILYPKMHIYVVLKYQNSIFTFAYTSLYILFILL